MCRGPGHRQVWLQRVGTEQGGKGINGAAGEAGCVDSGHVTEDLKLWAKHSGDRDLPGGFFTQERDLVGHVWGT